VFVQYSKDVASARRVLSKVNLGGGGCLTHNSRWTTEQHTQYEDNASSGATSEGEEKPPQVLHQKGGNVYSGATPEG
jgi:hypothetical protein